MNINRVIVTVGICLMLNSIAVIADEPIVGGRSSENVFGDPRVSRLLTAVAIQNMDEARRLLTAGVQINAVGDGGVTPLLWMLAKHDVSAMKMLLDLGADPNGYITDGVGPPVWLAAAGGQADALDVLLNHGGDAELAIAGKSPLLMAVSESHIDCAELLLRHGADINYAKGSITALEMSMLHVQFGDALWVLNHGYTHDPKMAKRMLNAKKPRPGQEEFKIQALARLDKLIATKPD